MRHDFRAGRIAGLVFCLWLASPTLATPTESDEGQAPPDAEKAVPEEAPPEASTASSQLRLDEITIEGEVDVPRVLFIESRDRLRRAEFLHHLFLRDATELGREAPLGRGISWTPNGPNEE